ncbi:MAG TPA: class I SAM-dependent methyltransferase [Kiloniellales bacterium]|nr:class I SAM-dependent methyltransferase [Kiloniellales bacterium]
MSTAAAEQPLDRRTTERGATDTGPTKTGDAEVFLERVCGILDSGAVAIMLSVGHRTGLFDVMAGMPPSSSAAIADQAGLAERYVREWLAALVMADIVHHDPIERTYHLPSAHAACLTREAPLGNMAFFGEHIALLGQVRDRVLECFRSGGGTRYEDYPCFHQLMAEDSGQTVVAQLFETILPLVPGLTERLETGIRVMDAGCGRGLAMLALARRYPRSSFVGYDLGSDAIEYARQEALSQGLTGIRFEQRDLSGYDEEERYDLITSFDAVHDQKDPQALLHSFYRALKPGGHYLMQDVGASADLENNRDFPLAALFYTVSCFHCMPVSLGQGGLGLGTMWGWETALSMLRSAGFADIQLHRLPHDPTNVWFVSHKRGD